MKPSEGPPQKPGQIEDKSAVEAQTAQFVSLYYPLVKKFGGEDVMGRIKTVTGGIPPESVRLWLSGKNIPIALVRNQIIEALISLSSTTTRDYIPQIAIGKADPDPAKLPVKKPKFRDGKIRESSKATMQNMVGKPEILIAHFDRGIFDVFELAPEDKKIALRVLEDYVGLNNNSPSEGTQKLVGQAKEYILDLKE